MNMQSIKVIAKQTGVKVGKLKKVELVKAIQIEEGNFNCFATAVDGFCDQAQCIWQDDCFILAKKKSN